MERFFIMLRLQGILLIFLLVGVYARKREILPASVQPHLSNFLVRITLPCMIFHSFQQGFSSTQLRNASQVLLLSLCICTASALLGSVLFRRMPPARRAVMRYGTLISNAGFAGLPQAQGAYGQIGLFYASVFLIPMRVFMWSVGISLFVDTHWKKKVKNVLLNPGILAVFLGLARMLLGISLPESLDSAIEALGACTTPLAMCVIGTILADVPLQNLIDRDVLLLTVLRLFLLPGAVVLVTRAVGMEPVLASVSVLLTGMPVGATTSIIAQKYGADSVFASKCVLVSTVLSLLSIPLVSI